MICYYQFFSELSSVIRPLLRKITSKTFKEIQGVKSLYRYTLHELSRGSVVTVFKLFTSLLMKTVKIYRKSVQTIADQHGYHGVRAYEFVLSLKALYPHSYIFNYASQITSASKALGIDRRTFKSRIERLKKYKWIKFKDNTLHFLSYHQIRHFYGSKSHNQHRYETVNLDILHHEVILQPLAENIRRQERVIKSKIFSNRKAGCQSDFRENIKLAPQTRLETVNTTLLSQGKVATLLGYKSKSSGHRKLNVLSMAKRLAIESNMIELSREEYNRYKETHLPRLLIKGKGKDAKFFYCIANTVRILKVNPVPTVGESYFNSIYW